MDGRRLSQVRAALAAVWLAACRGAADGDLVVLPGVEAPGTCALEGYLRGDDGRLQGAHRADVSLTWRDEEDAREGARAVTVTALDRRFRVAGLPCVHRTSFAVSVRVDGGRGGALHSTLGGVVAQLSGRSGDRLAQVRVDLTRGLRLRGVVRDARTGAALDGVRVAAMYQGYGRDGWSRPQEFAVSDAEGRWRLYGVQRGRLRAGAPPTLTLYRQGYQAREVEVALPVDDAEVEVTATLEPAR